MEPMPGVMQNTDEALQEKPHFCLEGELARLYKVENAQVGQKFKLTATAIVTETGATLGGDGAPVAEVKFQMDNLQLEGETDYMATVKSMYPSVNQ